MENNRPSRVCFVCLTGIYSVPYIHQYIRLLDFPFDIIFWNRCSMAETCGANNHYVLNYEISRVSKLQKLMGYIKFRRFTSKLLRENHYSKVVLLSGNAAVLLQNVLLRQYRGRYVIDIRDYFLESSRLYRRAEARLIENAGLAVISSEGYLSFLPRHDYILSHNSPDIPAQVLARFQKERELRRAARCGGSPVVLSFIGCVRFLEQDKKVLRFFANDNRFFIRYIGAGANQLRPFCEEHGIRNVYLRDRFSPDQTLDFYKETDGILNLYGSGTPLLDYALSNKLYYAAALEIPILVCPDTYMASVAISYHLGLSVDLDSRTDEATRIFNWIRNFDPRDMHAGCTLFQQKIKRDERSFQNRIGMWINEMEKQGG